MLIGSHVGMKGKDMFLGSVKEALSYGANTFMVYTGAPQNTRRKEISELNIEAGWKYAKEHGIEEIIVHAPYIINLANTIKPETYELAVEFLEKEIIRTAAINIICQGPPPSSPSMACTGSLRFTRRTRGLLYFPGSGGMTLPVLRPWRRSSRTSGKRWGRKMSISSCMISWVMALAWG